MKKYLLILILLLLISSLSSCKKFDKEDKDNLYAQIILNNNDKINLKLDYNNAPKTVDNFIKLCEEEFYNDMIFHRIISGFMIQGGGFYLKDDKPVNKSASKIVGEFSENGHINKIKHELGVISMARATDPDSASSQFFICSAKTSSLDGKYAAFGKATDQKSLEVIVKISHVETYYYNDYFQDYPVKPVIIKTIKLANKQF